MDKYIKIIAFALLSLMISCKEDFVEVTNPNTLSPENFPTTMSHLDLMLHTVYASQHNYGMYKHALLTKGLYMWDHTANLQWLGTPSWNAMGQNNTLPNGAEIRDTWRDAWVGVQRANAMLDAVTTFREKYAVETNLTDLDHIEGQAHFLRAWFYYYLINIWGESFIVNGQGGEALGVPIIKEVASTLEQARVSRATVRETWDFILEDLGAAEGLLADKVWTGAKDKHKAGIWAVKGFLGKAYLFTGDRANARTYLKDVIDNSGKSLVPFDVYKDMFNDENEFNAESIFEIQLTADPAPPGRDNGMGSSVGMVASPTFVNDQGGPANAGWSNIYPHQKNVLRFGFKEYTSGPFLPGTAAINSSNVDPAYVATSVMLRETKAVDPRLWVSMLQPYVDTMVIDNKKRAISHFNVELNIHAWSFRKNVNLTGTSFVVGNNDGANFYWLRLADVYLMYAEVVEDNAIALEYINKVKRRAYGYPVDSPSPVDYTSLVDETLASDLVLGNDPLKYERWAEFFGEGHWWFDVRRWQIGDEEAAYYGNIRSGVIDWVDSDYAQPIPQSELEANANIQPNASNGVN